MESNWKRLDSPGSIEGILRDSKDKPQLIFKHSTSCPISHIAAARLNDATSLFEKFDTYKVLVKEERPMSLELANQLDVHHESPQVIIVIDGEATYDESHLDISKAGLLEHLDYYQKKS